MLHPAHEKRIVRFSQRFSQPHLQAARGKSLKCRELCGILAFRKPRRLCKDPEIGKRFPNLSAHLTAGILRNSINARLH
jgi:hypothetical protein